jgi:glycosyltransferase involved in cell wall biosynthesis
MKIVIISNTTWNVKKFRKGLVLSLIKEGHEIVIVAPEDKYIDEVLGFGCRYKNIKIDRKGTSLINDFYLLLQYLNIFYKEEPELILAFTIKPNIFGSIAANILSIPVINNISGLGTAFIKGGWLRRVATLLYKIALKDSKCVFFQNHDDKRLFLKEKLVDNNQVKVLPGSGINLQYYQSSNLHITQKPQDKFVFLLIARLIWDKGIKEYVDAARYIRNSNVKVEFQILGFLDVDNQTAVSRSDIDLWEKEGIIQYLGETDDVRPFIKNSDCVALPSYREGTPRTLLEASAMSKPIIATNVEGCRDVVDNGVNGYLCNVRDAYDLARKMKTMLNMDFKAIKQMGLKGREKMENEFDERIVIDRYISVVNEIVSQQ